MKGFSFPELGVQKLAVRAFCQLMQNLIFREMGLQNDSAGFVSPPCATGNLHQ